MWSSCWLLPSKLYENRSIGPLLSDFELDANVSPERVRADDRLVIRGRHLGVDPRETPPRRRQLAPGGRRLA